MNSARPRRNYGSAATLKVDGDPRKRTYLGFDLTDIEGADIESATLRLFVHDGSPGAIRIHGVADDSWRESSISWSSAPARTPASARLEPPSPGVWVEVDVTSLLDSGAWGFALSTRSGNGVTFGSSEWAAKPQLILVVSE